LGDFVAGKTYVNPSMDWLCRGKNDETGNGLDFDPLSVPGSEWPSIVGCILPRPNVDPRLATPPKKTEIKLRSTSPNIIIT
jgi:hypothetical protein